MLLGERIGLQGQLLLIDGFWFGNDASPSFLSKSVAVALNGHYLSVM
jgi:hypothetical protein